MVNIPLPCLIILLQAYISSNVSCRTEGSGWKVVKKKNRNYSLYGNFKLLVNDIDLILFLDLMQWKKWIDIQKTKQTKNNETTNSCPFSFSYLIMSCRR